MARSRNSFVRFDELVLVNFMNRFVLQGVYSLKSKLASEKTETPTSLVFFLFALSLSPVLSLQISRDHDVGHVFIGEIIPSLPAERKEHEQAERKNKYKKQDPDIL